MSKSRSDHRKRPLQSRRRGFLETLEPRLLLASMWQAPHNELDISGDGVVSPLDALVGINRLNSVGSGVLPTPASPPPYYDANGDGEHSAIDVLLVINALNNSELDQAQIQVDLTRDTAANLSTNADLVSFDPTTTGNVSAPLGVVSLTASLDGDQPFDLPLELSGDFSLAPELLLDGGDDGPHQIRFVAKDGRTRSTIADFSFVLDTQAPVLVAAPFRDTAIEGGTNSDGVTSNTLISGSVDDALSDVAGLKAIIDQQPVVVLEVTQAGEFSVPLDDEADGLHSVRVLAEDVVGNLSDVTVNVTIDRVSPQLAVALQSDTGPSGSTNDDTITSVPTIVGNVSDQTAGLATLGVQFDSGAVTPVVPDSLGAFQVMPALETNGSADGQHQVQVFAEDQAGNVSQQTMFFTFDTQGPIVAASLISDTVGAGGTNSDGITSTPGIGGSVSDSISEVVSLEAIVDQQSPVSVLVDQAGQFTLSLDTLSDGPHSVRLLAEDTAGNTSEVTVQMQLDRSAPQLDAMLENDTAANGQTNGDGVTADATIVGGVQDSTAVSVEGQLDDGSFETLDVDNVGDFRQSNNTPAEGPHVARFRAEDMAGNTASVELSFTLDTTAPIIDAFGLIPSQAQPDGSTELALVTLVGTTEPNVQIELSPGNFQTVANAQGDFQFNDYSLEAGPNNLTVRAIDAAGNQSDLGHSVTRTSTIEFDLREEGRFLTEESILVELGQDAGTRQLRFTLDADFDASDTTSQLGDVLLVYLLDPQDPSQTLLDGGVVGRKPLLELREDSVDFPAGLVTFDGFTAEIEVSSLVDETEGLLLFQLLSHDGDTASRITVGKIANQLDPEGIASPVFPPPRPAQQPGPTLSNLGSLQESQNLGLLFEHLSFDSQTGRYAADLRIRSEGGPAARQVALVFSDLDSRITSSNRSGTTIDGSPYLNLSGVMPPGGLAGGELSEAVEIEFDNADLLTLSFLSQILVGTSNRAPIFSAVGAITVEPGGFFQQQLSVSDL